MNAGRVHHYAVRVNWTGNRGSGTSGYRDYGREHVATIDGKSALAMSSDATFHGDAERHNPEDLLLAALASCHMLSYLHMAMRAEVVVTAYEDEARGRMETSGDSGRFVEVVLHPVVTIRAESDFEAALVAHETAHHACFMANSVNFPVRVEPRILIATP